MVLLILFAFVAGAATALSPCVLPILPVALAAGATGGRRRPLGVVTGLALSFTFATIALVYLISALGLPDGLLRTFAIVVLVLFGLSLLVPAASARVEAWLSRFTPQRTARGGRGIRLGPRRRRGPRTRVRALRGPDPRRGHHGLGLAAAHRRAPRSSRSPTGSGRP